MKRLLILCVATLSLLQSAYAQQLNKFEYAVGPVFGVGFAPDQAYFIGAGVLGGYRFNKFFSSGVGVDFMHYVGRQGQYYTDTNMPLLATRYNAIRPFVYCRYDILPDEDWCPYVGGRLGYAFVLDTVPPVCFAKVGFQMVTIRGHCHQLESTFPNLGQLGPTWPSWLQLEIKYRGLRIFSMSKFSVIIGGNTVSNNVFVTIAPQRYYE